MLIKFYIKIKIYLLKVNIQLFINIPFKSCIRVDMPLSYIIVGLILLGVSIYLIVSILEAEKL